MARGSAYSLEDHVPLAVPLVVMERPPVGLSVPVHQVPVS